jgi:hypothetical protein
MSLFSFMAYRSRLDIRDGCLDRPVCRSDRFVPSSMWRVDSTTRPTPNPLPERDGASDRRMDGVAIDRGARLGNCAEVSDPRSRQDLRQDIQTACPHDGHSRSSNCFPISLAEWAHGTIDWFDQTGVSRPCGNMQRRAYDRDSISFLTSRAGLSSRSLTKTVYRNSPSSAHVR